MSKRFLRWVFGSALTVRDEAIRRLQKTNRSLSIEVALLRAKQDRGEL